jgi:hypothetical protein
LNIPSTLFLLVWQAPRPRRGEEAQSLEFAPQSASPAWSRLNSVVAIGYHLQLAKIELEPITFLR